MAQTKIATCCYCGTRAALVLKGDLRHELACASCGAPLHNMKHLKSDFADTRPKHKPRKPAAAVERKAAKKVKKKKAKKGRAHRFFDEAFDLLDDIFD